MKVRALISFSGAISMTQGQTMQMEKGEVLTGLLSCGYVEEMEEKKPYLGIDLSSAEFKAVSPNTAPSMDGDAELSMDGDAEPPMDAEPPVEEEKEQPVAPKPKKGKSKAVDADESK